MLGNYKYANTIYEAHLKAFNKDTLHFHKSQLFIAAYHQ